MDRSIATVKDAMEKHHNAMEKHHKFVLIFNRIMVHLENDNIEGAFNELRSAYIQLNVNDEPLNMVKQELEVSNF